MKLNEVLRRLRRPYRGNSSLEMTVTFETHGFVEFDVKVEYYYEGESYTDHPYGSTYAREYHGANVEVISIKTLDEVDQMDDDDEKVIKTWPKGTEIEKLPGWKEVEKSVMKQINKHVHEKAAQDASDAEEDAAADRYERD